MGDVMRAVAIDRYGGPEVLALRPLPIPAIGPDEVLVRNEWAGVGEWDPFEREGGYAALLGLEAAFPLVLGSEGAGKVAAVGEGVDAFAPGDRVFALGFLNPKGGFYAGYTAVPAATVAPIPAGLSTLQAAAVGGVGVTALRGIEDVLRLRAGETLLVFGASGGVGHLAVQLARRVGARVFAVASGADGVVLAQRLGADAAVDGRSGDVLAAARAFAPQGIDAALLTAGGEPAARALPALRAGGRIAFPHGVEELPRVPDGRSCTGYYADPDRDVIDRLCRRIEAGPFEVCVAATFPLEEAARAHEAVRRHHLGKVALQIG